VIVSRSGSPHAKPMTKLTSMRRLRNVRINSGDIGFLRPEAARSEEGGVRSKGKKTVTRDG